MNMANFRNNGYDTIIIRCYRSSGSVDPVCPHTIYNAVGAGFPTSHIDVYMFPCPKCGNPRGQVQSMVNYIKSYNANYTRIWLDVEDTNAHTYWGTNTGNNRNFMTQLLIGAVDAVGHNRVGVYSSYYNWERIFGSASWDCCHSYPLWYAHYDNSQSFSDFRHFGGWTTPYLKQYAGDVSLCGLGVDKSWRP